MEEVEKVKTSLILTVWLFAAMTLTAVAQTPAPAPQPLAATVEEGKKLFVSYGCYQCHGYEAQGSSATGPRLGPRPLPYAGFSRYVRRPAGQMPPYTVKTMADAELEKIYAFIQTRSAPKPVDTIPLLAK